MRGFLRHDVSLLVELYRHSFEIAFRAESENCAQILANFLVETMLDVVPEAG